MFIAFCWWIDDDLSKNEKFVHVEYKNQSHYYADDGMWRLIGIHEENGAYDGSLKVFLK